MFRVFRYIALFFFILIFSSLSAQSSIELQIEELKKIEDENIRITRFLRLLTQVDTTIYSKELGAIYHEIGNAFSDSSDFENSEAYYKNAILVRSNIEKNKYLHLNESKYELAVLYNKNGMSKEQYAILTEIINANQKDDYTCNAYIDLGSNLARRNDPYGGLNYLNIALSDSNFTKNVTNEVKIRCKIVFVYATKYVSSVINSKDSVDLEVVQHHLSEIEKKFEASGLNKDELMKAYYNSNLTIDIFGFLEKSEAINKKVLAYYKLKNDTFSVHKALINLGIAYSRQNKHRKADACYNEVILYSNEKEQLAEAYNSIAFYSDAKSFSERVSLAQNAVNIILDQKIDKTRGFLLPSFDLVLESEYEYETLIYLIDLLGIYVKGYQKTKEKEYLFEAKLLIHLVDRLVSLIRSNSLNENSKLFWIREGVDTYLLGAEVSFLLNDIDDAFYFLEKNKAILLQENIKSFQGKLELDIPNSILEREYLMRYQISGWQEKINTNVGDLGDKGEYQEVTKKYGLLIDSLVKVYPDYMKTKEEVHISSLKYTIDKYVSDQSCFVEYILGEQDGYGIFSSHEGNLIFKIDSVEVLQKELSQFKSFLSQPLLSKKEKKDYRKIGKSLFAKLFPFKDALELLKNKKLTIVPDQNLQNIPFEAFPVLDSPNLSDSYLVNQCEISYLQSVSLFQQIDKRENLASQKILGIAPYNYDFDELSSLEESKSFMTDLSKYEGSEILTETTATKKNFLTIVNDFELIHISTHGGVDTETQQPWLAFSDDKLTLNELLGIENNAELVVLDACKTNQGKLISGEGIINLSRGFFYNGTKSVLSSLWNVNERSGNEIMTNFYDHLNLSNTKSKALQLAKIDYLKSHSGAKELPYYWAVHTLTGNTNPVELKYYSLKRNILLPILISLGIIFFFLFWWFFNRN